MKQYERVTFSQAQQVLQHAVDFLDHVADMLAELDDGEAPERVRLLLESFETEQRALKGAMERYREDAPERVLNTYTQYAVELPGELGGPELPLTTLKVTQWLQSLNRHVAELFHELAESTGSDEVRTAFAGLADQMMSHERKLSKEYQRFEDV